MTTNQSNTPLFYSDIHVHNVIIFPLGPRTTNTDTLTVSREEIFHGIQKQGQPIDSQLNLMLCVGCKMRRNPQACLKIIPCENEYSRHVSIEGELLILRGCSLYKWFVEYCRCSIVVTVKVFDPANTSKELCSVIREFSIQYSELNIDHLTRIRLEEVLDHELVLYNERITEYAFKVTVQLCEHQVSHCDVPFECKDCEELEEVEGFIEIVPKNN